MEVQNGSKYPWTALDAPQAQQAGSFLWAAVLRRWRRHFGRFSPRLGTCTGGHEVKTTRSGPLFGLLWAGTLAKSVSGTARTLCYAWHLPLHLPASHTPLPAPTSGFRFFLEKNEVRARATRGDTGGATQARRRGATQAGRHRRGDTWLGNGTVAVSCSAAGEDSAGRPRANVRSAPGSR